MLTEHIHARSLSDSWRQEFYGFPQRFHLGFLPADEFKDSKALMWADHEERVKEFRATEFVMVGPTVTCRGETICEPVKVPLDEHAYRARGLADSWRALKSGVQVMGSHFQQAASLIVDAAKVLDGLIENNDNERK